MSDQNEIDFLERLHHARSRTRFIAIKSSRQIANFVTSQSLQLVGLRATNAMPEADAYSESPPHACLLLAS